MQIKFDIPENIADQLRADWGGSLDQNAKEALAIEAYRRGLISIGRFAELLGVGVIEADRWLAERKVPLNYNIQQLDADRRTLADIVPERQG